MIGLAAAPLLCLLTCLILTKSRSAWIGLFLAVAVLAWQERRQVPARLLLGAGLAGLVLVVALVAVGLATGRLDREVLTQSPLSMRYRWEYWQGAWGVITEGTHGAGPRALDVLVGRRPGQFRQPLPAPQAAAVERGDSGPARSLSGSLGHSRILGRAGAGRRAWRWRSGTCWARPLLVRARMTRRATGRADGQARFHGKHRRSRLPACRPVPQTASAGWHSRRGWAW